MKPNLDNVVKGASSYFAFILIVYFAMRGWPAWAIPIVAIGDAFLFYYITALTITFLAAAWTTTELVCDILYGNSTVRFPLIDSYILYQQRYNNEQRKILSRLHEGYD